MKNISDEFHKFYEANRIWERTSWLGIPIWKLPFDAFIIQEIICRVKPDYIIETGTNFGGSSVFYASILELIGHGTVVTIDKEDKFKTNELTEYLASRRIMRILGDSIDESSIKMVRSYIGQGLTMVILDSWHTKEHVLKELHLYSSFVSVGSYVIVEDTHVSGHPIRWKWGEGPYEAVKEFLQHNSTFEIDKTCEKLGMTFNPCGYLKKVFHGGTDGNTQRKP